MLDPDLQMKLAIYRRKAADGTISLEEMREAVSFMRAGRLSAAQGAKARSAKAPAVDADALLSSFEAS
ncbi:MAG: hypothetical protein [Siphoviridae sp. ctdEk19]|nr:MAG: hypothetical protein [Siphoviridae sp. ctdEk19]